MINSTNSCFSNQNQVTNGELIFLNRDVFKVGADLSHKFGETIKLQNGSPLKVSPDDYILRFRLIKGKEIQDVELPSSLFTQARKANSILFTQNEENFELVLSPSISCYQSKLKSFSFDECLKGITGQGCTHISQFLYEEDRPKYKKSSLMSDSLKLNEKEIYNDQQQKKYIRWGKDIELSSEAQRLEMGKKGCIATDFKELVQSIQPINENWDRCEVRGEKNKDSLLLYINIPYVTISDKVGVDLIVDSNRLYVHCYPKEFIKNFDGVTVGCVSEKFYWINLTAGSKQIDKNSILATPEEHGILKIHLPYTVEARKKSLINDSDFFPEQQELNPEIYGLQIESNFVADILANDEEIIPCSSESEDDGMMEIIEYEQPQNTWTCLIS